MSDAQGIRRLYKSRTDRMIDGVCGGIAKYFSLDPTLVRIAWVLLTLFGGSGIILYIVAMIIMPKEPFVFPNADATSQSSSESPVGGGGTTPSSRKNSLFWGILLMIVGSFLFLHNMGFSFWHPWWWFDKDVFLPVLLILVGVAFLWGGRNSLSTSAEQPAMAAAASQSETTEHAPRRLFRSYREKKLFGVCGGLAEYFEVDPTIVRLLFIAGAFASGGVFLIGYLIMAVVVPKEIPSFKMS